MEKNIEQECFIIMPISDPKGYEKGHFKRVYEDVIIPACKRSGFKAIRADDIEKTEFIHLSILKKLIEAPMSICDLSSRNPNVLFELGLRQAFDKPVVLIQEKGTERIFDVSILRAYDYNKDLRYNTVINDQISISNMLNGTEKDFITGKGFNSIVKFMALEKAAQLSTSDDPYEQIRMQLFQLNSKLDDVNKEVRSIKINNIEKNTNWKRVKKIPNEFIEINDVDIIAIYNLFRESDEFNDLLVMEELYSQAKNASHELSDYEENLLLDMKVRIMNHKV